MLETPVLTDVTTRDAMAIIKIEARSIMQLRSLIQEVRKLNSKEPLSHLRCVITDSFSLEVKNDECLPAKYDLIFKIYPDGCYSEEDEKKYVSVFVSITSCDGTTSGIPLVVTLFLRNLKDEAGDSFKRSMKLTPVDSAVERGIRDFVSVQDFDKILEKDPIISFGVLIRHSKF